MSFVEKEYTKEGAELYRSLVGDGVKSVMV